VTKLECLIDGAVDIIILQGHHLSKVRVDACGIWKYIKWELANVLVGSFWSVPKIVFSTCRKKSRQGA
jgi:hypothetical protein